MPDYERGMRILVVHNPVSSTASAEQADVLVQVRQVSAALSDLGFDVQTCECTLNLERLLTRLRASTKPAHTPSTNFGGVDKAGLSTNRGTNGQPDLVFNLVESLGGTDRLQTLVPELLEAMGIPLTGSSSDALRVTTNKVAAKKRLDEAGLPTPRWWCPPAAVAEHPAAPADAGGPPRGGHLGDHRELAFGGDWIVKPIWEHASYGMDDSAVVRVDDRWSLEHAIAERAERLGCPCFAEQYIAGRELNVSLLACATDFDQVHVTAGTRLPQVLPPAEIDFSAFSPGRPHIVGYRAKWDALSLDYHDTPRRFEFSDRDRRLIDKITTLALDCWELFGLRGYARVDFRVDAGGRPWILEINANPCLADDAGFAAAVRRAGMTFPEAVHRIVQDALRPGCQSLAAVRD